MRSFRNPSPPGCCISLTKKIHIPSLFMIHSLLPLCSGFMVTFNTKKKYEVKKEEKRDLISHVYTKKIHIPYFFMGHSLFPLCTGLMIPLNAKKKREVYHEEKRDLISHCPLHRHMIMRRVNQVFYTNAVNSANAKSRKKNAYQTFFAERLASVGNRVSTIEESTP